MSIYYVYIYKHPETLVPFYVGYGKGQRMFEHLVEAKRSPKPVQNQPKLNKIRKLIRNGLEPLIEVVDSNLTKGDACELEEFLISVIGRLDLGTGPLTNLTVGGDGHREWTTKQRNDLSLLKQNMVLVTDPTTGETFTVHNQDPRWLSGALVGVNKGKTLDYDTSKGYIQAKSKSTGENFRVKPDDPRWLSGDLVGVNKGAPCHENTRLAASKTHKGIPKSKEHTEKVSNAMKLLKWYCNFELNVVGRFKLGEQPDGYVQVSGPHKRELV